MTDMLQTESERWPSLDDVLGPAKSRYFGAGYRYVCHLLRNLRSTGTSFSCIADIRYPSNWSTGHADGTREPHLSTIDAVVVPLMAIERVWPQCSSLQVSSVDLRAGNRPWTTLSEVPLQVSFLGISRDHAHVQRYSAKLGNISATLELTNDISGDNGEVKNMGSGLFDPAYQAIDSTTQIAPCASAERALRARHGFDVVMNESQTRFGHDESFASRPALTVVDYLVTMGQMAQALIGKDLKVNRGAGQLWMRRVSLSLPPRRTYLPCAIESSTELAETQLIEKSGTRVYAIVVDSHTSDGAVVKSRLAQVEGAL